MPAGAFGHIESLPNDVRDIFMWLCQDVAHLFQKWDFYLGLFDTSENRDIIDRLPQTFMIVEESLRIDMTMAIYRLADRARVGRQENLNFRALEDFYPRDNVLKGLIAAFVTACEPVIKHRHKLVGHSDKVARLEPEQAMIPQIKKTHINEIIKNGCAILNHIAGEYEEMEFSFALPGAPAANALLYWLKKGLDNRLGPDS